MMNGSQHPDADVPVPDVGKVITPMADLGRRARESDAEPCLAQRYSGCEQVCPAVLGEREEQLLQLGLGNRLVAVGAIPGAAFPHPGCDDLESGAVQCSGDRGELGDDVFAVTALFDHRDHAVGEDRRSSPLFGEVLGYHPRADGDDGRKAKSLQWGLCSLSSKTLGDPPVSP